jgi:hypothetical protein
LAGLGGLHQLGLGMNQQGLQAGELGANTANQMIRNQIAKSGVKTNFQEALGNVGGVADIVGRGADVITGF